MPRTVPCLTRYRVIPESSLSWALTAPCLGGLFWGIFCRARWWLWAFLVPLQTVQQALVAVRRVLLAQFSAFPTNGADLYEELKSSTAILPTGSPRWVPSEL